ncbi:MAG: D-alanyl-D-alanine carboxypeptidase/D-alanyl-D-alanine-endopeptidase [Candidatus Acidiferrum sp.]
MSLFKLKISRRSLYFPFCLLTIATFAATARAQDSLAVRVQKVMARPEFARANFGIEFLDLATGKVVYAHDANKFFVPASTTKLLTEGTLLAKLGADYRFHTKVYRTGPLDKKGRLKGDLILVASGDPNLSNRIRPDGTLAFEDEDHSYGGPAVSGDPLAVIKELAKAVHDKGVKKIEGRVLVDASLMPDGPREGGTGVVMSSIMVNDNVIDLVATPSAKAGEAVRLSSSPQTGYIHFVNHLVTVAADGKLSLEEPAFSENPDGSVSATLNGSIPAGREPQTASIGVPSPTAFTETVLREALRADGIEVKNGAAGKGVNFTSFRQFYSAANELADHTSVPLTEEIKVTLKVSQNLHAGMGPYLLGVLVAKEAKDPLNKGFEVERAFFKEANLELSGVSQGDGAGGDWADLFSPEFVCSYLKYWTTRADYDVFFHALPILGKDGTLAKIQTQNPGAGHVFAKTGTFGSEDRLNGKMMLNGKGLAGYVITKSGRKLAFAAYVNHVPLPDIPDAAQEIGGQALGEIAAAAYDSEF